MLLRMRALTMGARALAYYAFGQVDRGTLGDREAGLRADVLTPLAKAWCTDVGCEVASLGIQVHGGMGYIEETGAAQHLRDARIAPIYEGTNGIQAADLGRPQARARWWPRVRWADRGHRAEAQHRRLIALADEVEITGRQRCVRRRRTTGSAGSYPFLTMCAVLVAGWLLERLGTGDDASERDGNAGRVRRSNISCR